MKYGYFDDTSREYVITQPNTPLPWINYLGCEEYFGLISNTAGGYSFYKDARLRRLTRYRYNNSPLDMGGRYLYLRDNKSGKYWSPSWMPTRTKLDEYECRHGQGYTVITSKFNGIKSSTRYFVPLGESLEIWQMTLANESGSDSDLSLFSAIEFCLWDANDDATNFQRNYSIGQVEIAPLALEEREAGGEGLTAIYHKTEYRERRNHFAYFACSEKLAGYDTQREAFLGNYQGWDQPQVVESGSSLNSEAHGWQPIGSQHVKVHLKAGEQKQVVFILGYHENPKDDKFDPPTSQIVNKKTVKPIIEKYLQPANADEAFNTLRDYWTMLLGKFQVTTPDTDTNRMVNIWNAYQCMVTFNMSRSASYFESGIGRGDHAFDYYKRINPSAREEISELHKREPYVYAQMIAGKDAATHGEAKNSWLTGTAAWNYAAITQYILGIRPTFDGLEIAPVIPANWDGFKAARKYRDVTYHITVTNPRHVCKGVEKITVNGKQAHPEQGRRVDGNLIRAEKGAGEVNLEVIMG